MSVHIGCPLGTLNPQTLHPVMWPLSGGPSYNGKGNGSSITLRVYCSGIIQGQRDLLVTRSIINGDDWVLLWPTCNSKYASSRKDSLTCVQHGIMEKRMGTMVEFKIQG